MTLAQKEKINERLKKLTAFPIHNLVQPCTGGAEHGFSLTSKTIKFNFLLFCPVPP
jgi:hypothetical protein